MVEKFIAGESSKYSLPPMFLPPVDLTAVAPLVERLLPDSVRDSTAEIIIELEAGRSITSQLVRLIDKVCSGVY